MASQIYSRYIPTIKKQKLEPAVSSKPPSQPLFAPPEIIKPTPPTSSTRTDASSTYTRYVPPLISSKKPSILRDPAPPLEPGNRTSSKRIHEETEETDHKKRLKRSKEPKPQSKEEGVERVESIANFAANGGNQAKDVGLAKVKSRKEKRHSHVAGTDGTEATKDTENVEEEARHKKLMGKREKSLRKAEKLARKEAEQAELETGDETIQEPAEIHDLVPLPQPEPVPEAPIQSSSASLPLWLARPIRVAALTKAPFSTLGVPKEAEYALASKGFREAFAVQAAVLPLLLPGASQSQGDILVSAATGSGKTLAYVLPMVEEISRSLTTNLRGLIIMPTRELVTQAREVSEILASAFSAGSRRRIKIGSAVGSETFKAEQTSLMDQELVFDPEAYRAQIDRLNSKWKSSDVSSDEDEPLCGDETSLTLENHVLRPTPKVDILICTPGRLVEHLKSTLGFSLQNISWLVVDEADKLLDQSFQQWLDVVIGALPVSKSRSDHIKKIVLSATLTRDIGQLNSLRLYRPKLVVLEGTSSSNDTDVPKEFSQAHVLPSLLVEAGIKVDEEGIKPLYLLELFKRENLLLQKSKSSLSLNDKSSSDNSSDSDSSHSSDSSASGLSENDSEPSTVSPKSTKSASQRPIPSSNPRGVLVFTKSNETAVRLGRLLAILEPKSSTYIGTLTSTTRSSTRRSAINSFESGKLSILIASDLVSRGLDLPNLAHVINYDVPTSVASYVHRVGRTARAGKRGHAWTLFTSSEAWWFWNEIGRSGKIERAASSKIDRLNISTSTFNDDQKKGYEAALETLKLEANMSNSKKSKSK